MHPEKLKHEIKKHESKCLNCGTPLLAENRFCSNCGQMNRSPRQSLGEWIREFFASFLSVDSKFIHSIIPLLVKPGKLSEDYIAGKRARYIHPIRLYLAVSILMFFVISLNKNPSQTVQVSGLKSDSTAEGTIPDEALQFNLSDGDTASWWYEKDVIAEYLSENKNPSWVAVQRETDVENSFSNRFFFTEVNKMYGMDVDSFGQYIFRKLPIVLFLFLPFFTLWIHLLYLRKGLLYTEHLIFAFHTQTAFFTLLLLSNLAKMAFNWDISAIVLLIFMIYLYLALRRFYKQSRFVTVIKYVLLNAGFLVFSILFVILGSLTLFILY